MLGTLTSRQKQILDYINFYYQLNSIAPSLEEIKQHFKLRAVSTVHEHIEKLKLKGYLSKEMNQARGIRTSATHSQGQDNFEVNLLGNIAAGEPIEAVENAEPITVSRSLLKGPGPFYALKVVGNSMIEDGIFDQDIVIIRSQSTAIDGETVVAVVDDERATLKKFYKERDRFKLVPANSEMEPKYYKRVDIRGKLIALVRKY